MKVAVLTARAATGERGGAERFYEGLVSALAAAGADVTELPLEVDETTFESIEAAYLKCWDLDVSGFDMAISTKAPTYMVRHSRHVCYLMHTMRVFYDMFDVAFPAPTDGVCGQRDLVRRLDTLALGSDRTRKVFTIGAEVSARLKLFNDIDSEVLHPPLAHDHFRPGPQGDYIFMPGRLHPWKRVALGIEAMRRVKTPVRLVVAGTGEQESELKALSRDLPSVAFVGRIPDSELGRLYSGALGVAFVPVREDYGYVTIEAFRSGKPVVTCKDSGEAAALVLDGLSGLVVDPTAEAVAAAMDSLWLDRSRAAAMGDAGSAFADKLRWDRVAASLLAA